MKIHTTSAFIVVLFGVFIHPLADALTRGISSSFVVPPTLGVAGSGGGTPLYREDFVHAAGLTQCVHCPTLVELAGGDLLAVWYGGTKEGARDVALYQSRWVKRQGVWSPPRLLTDASRTQADLGRYVRKLGNAVLERDAEGKIRLLYVSVAAGGWSGSAINCRVSDDNGLSWSPAKRLVTSPFLNMGMLVRCPPVLFSDGSSGLPAYIECFGKFGEFIRIGRDGGVLDKARMSWGRSSLQPSVVPMQYNWAIAFMRQSGTPHRRILRSDTDDGGLTWGAPWNMTLPNPDSAVMGLRARDGTLLLAFNAFEVDRDVLSLAVSTDRGRSWKEIHQFEKAAGGIVGYSYPYIIQTADGMFHVLYSWNRERIKHVSFNEAWLRRL
jgi:predicted neuraminidase